MNEKNLIFYQKSALTLAFVGDSVFSTYIRSGLASTTDYHAGELNAIANKIVCAKNQAKLFEIIKPNLVQTEQDIAMRARNVSPHNVAKSSTLEEYQKATSFEAIIGYLYLSGQFDRLNEIYQLCGVKYDN